jgi:hypothetical protein
MPVWIPTARVGRGSTITVWGQLRPATQLGPRLASIQWRGARGRFATIVHALTNGSGYFSVRVRPPGTGQIRIVWRTAKGVLLNSRTVSVTVR